MPATDILPSASQGYKVDISRGGHDGRVSSEWFNRPDDERFLSLDDLYVHVRARADRARTRIVDSRDIRVEARPEDAHGLTLVLPDESQPIRPTHWGFGQLASLVGAPASWLRQVPAPIAAINLQYGLASHRAEMLKILSMEGSRPGGCSPEMRAATGPDYGRIWDHELVEAVRSIAGNGAGDTRWKVPGTLDWSTMRHNPYVDVTKENTTLYASDRDVFLFLVDDLNPIEAGRLSNGDPDLYFRGFYAWNSEVGSKTLGLATFYLRAVCANRNIWGQEQFECVKIRHSKFAGHRFAREAAPALEVFANSSADSFVRGVQSARERIVARDDDERLTFLRNQGFAKGQAQQIVNRVLAEEGRKPSSIYDFVQGITAVARTQTHQDARLVIEGQARKLMERVR